MHLIILPIVTARPLRAPRFSEELVEVLESSFALSFTRIVLQAKDKPEMTLDSPERETWEEKGKKEDLIGEPRFRDDLRITRKNLCDLCFGLKTTHEEHR